MGEAFLSATVAVLLDRLTSPDLLDLARQVDIDAQLKQWKKTLSRIQSVLNDAEDKQFADECVKNWLADLQDLAYDLDDLLDELATEVLRQKVMARSQATTSQVSTDALTNEFSPYTDMYKIFAKSKIDDISGRFEEIFEQKDSLDLKVSVGGGIQTTTASKRLPSTSLIESYVCGRGKDKEAILKMLLTDEENDGEIGVIPILGMGGIGKTTLSRMVYNDDRVRTSFERKAWACVSDNFDVFGVTKTVIESLTSQPCYLNDLNTLQVALKEELSGKKILLVLDDIWSENYEKWDVLRRPFSAGASGSKIIISTRNASVASMMSSVPPYHLKELGNDDSLSLFAHHALGRRNFDAHQNLKAIGEEILKKCRGSPLAVKALGGLLRNKLHQHQWEDILNSKIWDLPEQRCDIFPALRLSYHHLPSHLKQCFAFCAIFPTDYGFNKDELFLLWMAVGLLHQSKGRKQIEYFGNECFEDLLSRSFFQQSSVHNSQVVMHDLISDLAKAVAGETCFRLEDKLDSSEQHMIFNRARHSSYIRQKYELFWKFGVYNRVQNLQTFLPLQLYNSYQFKCHLTNKVLSDLLPKLKLLRVLSLRNYSITLLPNSIGELKLLRYLDLSKNLIKTLPESVCSLINLQMLNLHGCELLCKLPASFGNLISLRHLVNTGTTSLEEMPFGICRLTSLQTISKVVVGKGNGLALRELSDLMFLRGKLSIEGLKNVMDTGDAKKVNLRYKKDLVNIEMNWSRNSHEYSFDEKHEMNVLDILQPHTNLEELKILNYGGRKFSKWIGDPSFSKVVDVRLYNCRNCTSLPPLGQLRMLKTLRIRDMNEIRSVGVEFYTDMEIPFPSLETLEFMNIPEWEVWSCSGDTGEEVRAHFPCLRELTVVHCPKLVRISLLQLPSLCKLYVQSCPGVVLKSFSDLTSLTELTLYNMIELTSLPEEFIQILVVLKSMVIFDCHDLETLWKHGTTLEKMVHLKRLSITNCSKLLSLGNEEEGLPCNLQVLEIYNCENLEKLPKEINELTCLKRLKISKCNTLESLPNVSISCEDLETRDCTNLRSGLMVKSPSTLRVFEIGNLGMKIEQNHSRMSLLSLENLLIYNTWESFGTIFFWSVNNFPSLIHLGIWNCDDLESLPERGLRWPATPKLKSLWIMKCEKFRFFDTDQIQCLKTLRISDCPNLRSFEPNQVQSLETLSITACPNLGSFPDTDMLPNLKSLEIRNCEMLNLVSKWGLHRLTSLQKFSITGGHSDLVSFSSPDDDYPLLPPTLTHFKFKEFPNLETLSSGLQNLTSLEKLEFWDCAKLRSLPKEGLLSNLSVFSFRNCPLLKQRCLPKDKAEYWPIIADIPCAEIDGYSIYDEPTSAQ